jgi:hypothetical protein
MFRFKDFLIRLGMALRLDIEARGRAEKKQGKKRDENN